MDLLIWRSINLFRERSSILRDRGGFENRTLPDPDESYSGTGICWDGIRDLDERESHKTRQELNHLWQYISVSSSASPIWWRSSLYKVDSSCILHVDNPRNYCGGHLILGASLNNLVAKGISIGSYNSQLIPSCYLSSCIISAFLSTVRSLPNQGNSTPTYLT